jgi:hypothetical protein
MRNLVRSMADGLWTIVIGIFVMGLHFSLLTIFKSHLQRPSVLQHYRPVYTRSGHRNRVRC